jgi:cytosine deaminase
VADRRVISNGWWGGERVDLLIEDGIVIDEHIDPSTVECPVVDVGGMLLLPALAEPHAHLDKALTADLAPNPSGDLRGAIDAWMEAEAAGRFEPVGMAGRIRDELRRLLLSGTTAVRSHLNVGGGVGIEHLRVALDVAEEFAGAIDVQLVAMITMPLTGPGSETNVAALREAVEAGVHLVGGCPHLEPDPVGAIEVLTSVADQHRPIDLHVDETLDPSMQTVAEVISAAQRRPEVRFTASHCVSLSALEGDRLAVLADGLAESGVGVVALPQTNLFLQGRDAERLTPRGIAPVSVLRRHGVAVAAGGDNVQDPFNLVGRSDPLEAAALMVMAAHETPEEAFDLVSNGARSVMGLPECGPWRGAVADVVAMPVRSMREAIADASSERIVFRAGREVARSSVSRSTVVDR